MFEIDFQPFPANCGSLSVFQNAQCDELFNLIINDGVIYSQQRLPIEKSLMNKIKHQVFDAIKACKSFENLIISHKKKIIEMYNKTGKSEYQLGKLTTKDLNKDMRRHISCLLVNNFLTDYENEIKQELNIKDDSDDEETEEETEEEPKKGIEIEITDNEVKIIDASSWCGGCNNTLIGCTCYDNISDDAIEQINEFESKYRKELYFHNETKEELKGACEVVRHFEIKEGDMIRKLKHEEEINKRLFVFSGELINENIKLKEERDELKKELEKLRSEKELIRKMLNKN